MLGHQAAYVDHLLEVVESERVDLVVLAGDVYDRALPPVDAVRLANEAFTRIAASRARMVVTSGNHDSAQRLGFGSELIDAAGVHLRTHPAGVGDSGAARRRPRAGGGLRPALPRPRPPPGAVGPRHPQPRRRAHRGDAPGPRRPRRSPRGHPLGGAGARVRRRPGAGDAQRVRARHQRRRRQHRAHLGLRRGHLRRPRPPARTAHLDRDRPLQRLPAGLLVLRGRRTARAPGWSTSAPAGSPPRSSSTPRSRGPWPGCAGPSTTCCSTRRWPATRTPGCRPR